MTTSNFYGANTGSADGFVLKLSKENGNLQWLKKIDNSIFQGPGFTNENDEFNSIHVDSSGIYVGGSTSSNMGEANGGIRDAFLLKLSEDNTDPLNTVIELEWVTQVGNVSEPISGGAFEKDECTDITVFGDHVYCTGYTRGSLGESNGGAGNFDIFILKVAKVSGAIKYLFQLGENSELVDGATDLSDIPNGIEVDENGIYLAGYTGGNLGGINGGDEDAFVMKIQEGIGNDLTVSGVAVEWVTQINDSALDSSDLLVNHNGDSSSYDRCNSITQNDAYVFCGGETSGELSGVLGGGEDAFVLKIAKANGSLSWLTNVENDSGFIGSSSTEEEVVSDIAFFDSKIFVTGDTRSNLADEASRQDIYISVFGPDGDFEKTTQLGKNTKSPAPAASYVVETLTIVRHLRLMMKLLLCRVEYRKFREDNGGGDDILIAKLSKETKEVIWVKQLGASIAETSESDGCLSIAIDDTHIIVVDLPGIEEMMVRNAIFRFMRHGALD